MDSNYSLSDIASVVGGNNTEGNWFWIIVLFLFMNGFGRNGFMGSAGAQGAFTRAELFDGLNYNQLENAVRGVQQGLCDGFYAQNTTMLQGFATTNSAISNLGYQMQNCCCETNRNIDAVRAENYKNTCEITTAIHAEGEATRALINQNTIQDLRDKLEARDRDLLTANFQLSQQAQTANIVDLLRPYPKPSYITCSPYTAVNLDKNCGCGCGCFA